MPRKKCPPEPRTLFYYETVVLKISSSTFRSHFRLTKKTFENLCQILGPVIAPKAEANGVGYPQTCIEKQILPVLWLLATPDSFRFVFCLVELFKFYSFVFMYRSVADRFNISKGTLFLYFERVVLELYDISHRYIK